MDKSIIDMPGELVFQSFSTEVGSIPVNVDEHPQRAGPTEGVESSPEPKVSVWQLEFYKKLFDVDTEEVLHRLRWSFVPYGNFLQTCVKDKPDLYGPFWISMTLIFSMTITGNIADYFQSSLGEDRHWKYNFHTVTTIAMVIFFYSWLLPCVIWAFLHWYGSSLEKLKLMQIISLYGYCLFIFVPLSALWLIPKQWFQWIITMSAATASGLVLMKAMFPVFTKKMYPVLFLLFFLHLCVASVFMLKFVKVSTVYQEPIASHNNSSLSG
ncbi:protein YIPF2 [Cimex lectularius]|uniref:Protein YIPF n=1 Tax=Cimex lectularius TaxID=79782 RepID=A0A8I6RSQ6_CIMLE|nr:protein YIPF2 [Cimex lectularius]